MNDDWMDMIRKYTPSTSNEITFNKADLIEMYRRAFERNLEVSDRWKDYNPVDDIRHEDEEMGFEEEDEIYENGWDEDERLNWETDLPRPTTRGWDLEDLPRPRTFPTHSELRGGRRVAGVRNPDRRLIKEVKIDETVTELDDDYLKRLGVK